MEAFLVPIIIIWIGQIIFALVFINDGNGPEIGINTKTQALYWLLIPCYVLYPLVKLIIKGIKSISKSINELE